MYKIFFLNLSITVATFFLQIWFYKQEEFILDKMLPETSHLTRNATEY